MKFPAFCYERAQTGKWCPVVYHVDAGLNTVEAKKRRTELIPLAGTEYLGEDGYPRFGALTAAYPAPAVDNTLAPSVGNEE